jgi:hypothetical protein
MLFLKIALIRSHKVLFMKKVCIHGRLLIISLFIAILLSGTALADVELDLGSAEGMPGDQVQIPIFLTNYLNGPIIVATSNEITYDSAYLTPLIPTLGPKGQEAGKNLKYNITEPGLYIVGILGTSDQNLKTSIPDGIVAYVKFRINDTAPEGTYILENSAGCSTDNGTAIQVSGTPGSIDVTGSSVSTTTTTINATGEITRITPQTISSSRWRPRLHLLIIRTAQGGLTNTSTLSFNPSEDIKPVLTIAGGRLMLAFVSVKANVQGQFDVIISTDTITHIKEESLKVRIVP